MTNKFISLVDGNRSCIAPNLSTRLNRPDCVSFTSRLRVLPILLLCLMLFLGVGNAWADYSPGTGYTLVTNISSLSTNDKVILFCIQNGEGVTGYNNNKDATVSTTSSQWKEYTVTKSTNSFTLKDGTSYIASPSGNEFKYGNSGGACTVSSTGLLTCNSRYLFKNGTNYRFYGTSSTYPNKFYVYKVSASYTVNWTINPAEYGSLSATTGTTTTVTPGSAYTYGSPAYTVTSGTASVSQSTNTFTATPSANCTIQVNMVEKPKYTVTLKDDETGLTQTSYGASVTLPSRTGCDGYTFAGWTKTWTSAQTEWTTTAPTIIPAGSYTPQADENLYPVYTKTEGGGTTYQFQKVTELSQIKAGGTFIITNGSYYLPNGAATNAGPAVASMVTVTNGVVTGTVTDAMKWTFSAADANNRVTIKSVANSNNYLYSTSDNNGLRVSTTSDSWTFEEYTVSSVLGFAMKSTSNSRYCAVYSTSNWRSYTTKNHNNYSQNSGRLDLYKYTAVNNSTTSYISVPNCCTPLGSINGSVF